MPGSGTLDKCGDIADDDCLALRWGGRGQAITSVGDVVAELHHAAEQLGHVGQQARQATAHAERGRDLIASLRGEHRLLRQAIAQFDAAAQRLRAAGKLAQASAQAINDYVAIIGGGSAAAPATPVCTDSRGRPIPAGVERLPSGKPPSNYAHAGKKFDGPTWTPALAAKYPDGVTFTADGYPDFSPYATHTVTIDPSFKGDRTTDFTAANRLAGLPRTPEDYTWHHHQDTRTLLLYLKICTTLYVTLAALPP